MGQLLHTLKEKGSFKQAIGAGVDTWDDYIAQPEISLSRGEADRLIQIYDQFVIRFGYKPQFISEIPIKNLHYLLPYVKAISRDNTDPKKLEEMLHSAKDLSQRDFRERVADLKLGESKRTYTYLVMKKCVETGTMSKVHDISSEVIEDTFGLQTE